MVSDPGFLEEFVCLSSTEEGINTGGGIMVIGMNQYKELCLMNLTGAAIYSPNIVHKAIKSAAEKSKEIVDYIKKSIADDDARR